MPLKEDWLQFYKRKNFTGSDVWGQKMNDHINADLFPIIAPTCDDTPGMIADTYNVGARKADPPWVRTGNLFLSCQYTGTTSWIHLVLHLYNTESRKNFAILSGRHGNEEGTHVDGAGIYTGATYDDKSREFVSGDKKCWADAQKIHSSAKFITLEHYELGPTGSTASPYNTIAKTNDLATQLLWRDRIVVFAWCYSIFHPFPFVRDTSETEEDYRVRASKAATTARQRSISDIMTDSKWSGLVGITAASSSASASADPIVTTPKETPRPYRLGPCRIEGCDCTTFTLRSDGKPWCVCNHAHPAF